MPRLITTKLGNDVRDRIVQELRNIMAVNPDVKNKRLLALRLKINQSHLTMWSQKKGYPSIEHLARMRKELGIDVNALIDGDEGKPVKSLADFEKRLQALESGAIKKPIKNK